MPWPTAPQVEFLLTLVTYPFAYMLAAAAARGEAHPGAAASAAAATAGAGAGGAGAVADGRRRLSDFPEGRAVVSLERWCRAGAYLSLWEEVLHRYATTLVAVVESSVAQPALRALLLNRWVLAAAGVRPAATLETLAAARAPRALRLLREGRPEEAIADLEAAARPNLAFVKRQLERRYALRRGPTPLERAEVLLSAARRAARAGFALLRLWARGLHYASSLLSIVSGALSFTVVPAIALSVLSAGAQIVALALTSAAEFGEPVVLRALDWGQAGTAQAGAAAGAAGIGDVSALGPRRLAPATVEGLAALLEAQIDAATPLVSRPGARGADADARLSVSLCWCSCLLFPSRISSLHFHVRTYNIQSNTHTHALH